MGRGRRPDATLEPSRQLLTQRAFRQRRANHLAELEKRVKELERENIRLRSSSTTSKRVAGTTAAAWDGESQEDGNGIRQQQSCQNCFSQEKGRMDMLQSVRDLDAYVGALGSSLLSLRQAMHSDVTSHAVGQGQEGQHRYSPATVDALARLESMAQVTGEKTRMLVSKASAASPYTAGGPFSAEPTPSPSPSSSKQAFPSSSFFSTSNVGSPSTMSTPTMSANTTPAIAQTNGFSQQFNREQMAMPTQSETQYAPAPSSARHMQQTDRMVLSNSNCNQQQQQPPTKKCRTSSSGSGCCPPMSSSSSASSSSISSPMQSQMSQRPTASSMAYQGGQTPTSPYSSNETRQRRGGMDWGATPRNATETTRSTPSSTPLPETSWSQLGGDETKCCLGFLECDKDGNIVIPASPAQPAPLQ